LRAVRVDLGRWQPPDVELGFRVVREAAPAARAWWRPPVWVPTALAAGLVLAVGAGLANLRVEAGNGRVTLRAGWSQPPASQAAAPAHRPPPCRVKAGMSEAEVHQALAALETKLRADFASPRATTCGVCASRNASNVDRGALLQQVHALSTRAKRRQQRELAQRLADVVHDFDAQRPHGSRALRAGLRADRDADGAGSRAPAQHQQLPGARLAAPGPVGWRAAYVGACRSRPTRRPLGVVGPNFSSAIQ
jgi:hypothetical protein